jgi:hypothetical protein
MFLASGRTCTPSAGGLRGSFPEFCPTAARRPARASMRQSRWPAPREKALHSERASGLRSGNTGRKGAPVGSSPELQPYSITVTKPLVDAGEVCVSLHQSKLHISPG